MRRGFTLIEMLIATAVFMVGFTAAYGLFLAGGRLRQEADSITRMALMQSQLGSELRLTLGTERLDPFWFAPSACLGDGFPDNGPETGFTPWPEDPRIWYRIVEANDILGGDDANQLALRLVVLTVDLGSDLGVSRGMTATVDAAWLEQRFNLRNAYQTLYEPGFDQATKDRIAQAGPQGSADWTYQVLVERGLLLRQEWVILRRTRPGA